MNEKKSFGQKLQKNPFLVVLLIVVIGVAIYQGKTNLIHDYHQTNVTDKSAYGKSFGKTMFVISTALLLSGSSATIPMPRP